MYCWCRFIYSQQNVLKGQSKLSETIICVDGNCGKQDEAECRENGARSRISHEGASEA